MTNYLRPNHSIRIGRNTGQYEQRQHFVGVRHQGPFVVLLIDQRPIALSTSQAHKVGWEMLRTADDCIREAHNGVLWDGHQAKQSVVLTVNGASMNVSPAKARKIAAALLRKSDPADDFQRDNQVKLI